jgi:hypothetical protein
MTAMSKNSRSRLIARLPVRTQGMEATYHVTNPRSEWYDKDLGDAVIYIEHKHADVEADHDLREEFPETAVAFVLNGRHVPQGTILSMLVPEADYLVIHKFSEDGRKAELVWKGETTPFLPEGCNF